MNMFRNIGIAGIFIAATGCAIPSTISKVSDLADSANEIATKANGVATIVKDRLGDVEAKMKAMDTNKDGSLSLTEILIGLGGLLGVSGGAIARRNAKSDARKTILEERYADLKRRLPPTV